MKFPIALTATFLLCSVLLPLPLSAETEKEKPAAQPLAAAVFNFVDGDTQSSGIGANVGNLLNAFLSAEENFLMVERQQLDTILSEQKLNLSGTVDPASAVTINRLTGAKVLITGRAFTIQGDTMLVAKVIGTETGRVFGETVRIDDGKKLDTATEELSSKIAEIIRKQRDELVSPTEKPEARLKRLKESLPADAKLPTVYVSIPEEHITVAIPDPAAQTEILLTLQELGFGISDKKETAKVIITGEAFSERAGELSGLISCRARVEITAHDRKGKLLFVDRQTEMVVDTAEQIAAKSALQQAGGTLAERMIGRITKK